MNRICSSGRFGLAGWLGELSVDEGRSGTD